MLSQPTVLTSEGKFVYDCAIACDGDLTDCEKKQACTKAKKLNNVIKKKKAANPRSRLKKRPAAYKQARIDGDKGAADFRAAQKTILANIPRGQTKQTLDSMKPKFMHECAHKEWKKEKAADRNGFKSFQADHVQEIQLGGAPGADNLLFMTSRVNGSFGGRMRVIPNTATGVTSRNCC